MGTLVMGKLESGAVTKGLSLLLMPNRVSEICAGIGRERRMSVCVCVSMLQVPVEVIQIVRVEDEVPAAYSGDNIKLRLKGVEEEVNLRLF